jgi:hypothetical protein
VVADGTSICPKCDFIIDSSFLSAEPPSGNDDEATGASEDPRKAAPPARPGGTGRTRAITSTGTRRVAPSTGRTGSQPAVKAVPSGGPSAKGPGSASGSKANIRAVSRTGSSRSVPAVRPAPAQQPDMELDDAEPRKPLLPPSPATKGYATTNSSGKIVAPEEIISGTREFFGELSRSDKIAFAGSCVLGLSCFVPWKETAADGEVLGLMSAGVGAVLSAALVIGAIFVRVRRTMPKINGSVPWMMQLGVSFISVLYTVIFIKSAFDSTQVPSHFGNQMTWNSSPSFGVFLGLFGAIGALVGSVMGLRERQ